MTLAIGIRGSKGAQLVNALSGVDATYVPKSQYSSFFDSNLLKQLKTEGVNTLILSGIHTEYCVLATAIDAFNFGFHVWLLEVS